MAEHSVPGGTKILVTGASGFIGTRLIKKLSPHDDFSVTVLVRDGAKARHFRSRGIRTVVADLSRRTAIERAVEGQHTVINLAHDFRQSQKQNLRSFTHLSEACINHRIQHFVQVSSIVVYDDWPVGNVSEESSSGHSGTEYKNTKVAIEKALLCASEEGLLHSSVLQPTIVYGPFSWLWTDYIVEKLLNGTVVLPAGGKGICNAVYIDDVVDALILAVTHPGRSGEKYIISGPSPPSWREFFESYNQFLGTDSIQYIDMATLADERSGLAGEMKNILANPLSLARWKPVQQVLNVMQKLLGKKGIDRLKSVVKSLKKSSGPIVYYPDAGELELYCAHGVCRIDKAKRLLGYEPRMDFKAGFELTTNYLDSKLHGATAGREAKKN